MQELMYLEDLLARTFGQEQRYWVPYLSSWYRGTQYRHYQQPKKQESPERIPGALVNEQGYEAFGEDPAEMWHYEREAERFKNHLESYLSSRKGGTLLDYLEGQGKDLSSLDAVGSMQLDDGVVAAYICFGRGRENYGAIVSNGSGKGFEKRVQDLAEQYQLKSEDAREYVMAHELMHAAGYDTEVSCEKALTDYFARQARASRSQGQAEKYGRLALTAAGRARQQEGGGVYVVPHTSYRQ